MARPVSGVFDELWLSRRGLNHSTGRREIFAQDGQPSRFEDEVVPRANHLCVVDFRAGKILS